MKKETVQTIVFIIVALLICLADSGCSGGKHCVQHQGFIGYGVNNLHTCKDATHSTCDGKCTCDGLGCEQSDYKAQFKALSKMLPCADSLTIDIAIKED